MFTTHYPVDKQYEKNVHDPLPVDIRTSKDVHDPVDIQTSKDIHDPVDNGTCKDVHDPPPRGHSSKQRCSRVRGHSNKQRYLRPSRLATRWVSSHHYGLLEKPLAESRLSCQKYLAYLMLTDCLAWSPRKPFNIWTW